MTFTYIHIYIDIYIGILNHYYDQITTRMLGIALVVEDANHGQRLAFRYPASSRMKISEKDKDKHDNNPYACLSKETDGDIYSDSNTSSSFLSGFFDLDPTFFAQLFRPKNEMCNKRKYFFKHLKFSLYIYIYINNISLK